jgi:two-component system cell cycle sensor histidine kinase/response regulator CckA
MALDPCALTAPRYREVVDAQVQEVIARGEVIYESADLRKDGSAIPVEVHARTVASDGRRLILSVARDVTERKRLEEQLRQAQKMETVGQLAGGIAHDFNNLLTAITGYAEFARDALPSQHPAREDIGQVLNGAKSAGNLIRQLLAFSRRQVIAPQALDLNDIIANLDKILRRLIGEHIELVTIRAADLRTVRVDPSQVEQLIVNLAVNARDAMPEGGRLTVETANVTLDADDARQHVSVVPGDYVLLSVRDTGCGMTDEVKTRIFEPYFTTKEPGKGTGLGLATCYGIVKQNNGHIWFHSDPGEGTSFEVYFPCIGEPAAQEPRRDQQACAAHGAQTVLLAEDEPTVRSFAARVLRQAGYTVLEAADGSDALELAAERPEAAIDLLVTDVVMPRMGGLELHRRLRTSRPQLKTLFVSGYTDNSGVHQGVLAKDVAFLQKPFTMATLAGKVREVLQTQ